MAPTQLDEREFEILNILGRELGSNQRDLSKKTELSLGMINMLIRRLITKGYIRIEQLNKRKVQYLLTPKGFAEKMRKSVKYTLNTINSIGLIKDNVKEILIKLHDSGYRKFHLYCESDLTILIEKAFSEIEFKDVTMENVNTPKNVNGDSVLLIGKENIDTGKLNGGNYIDMLAEISKRNDFARL